jgi:hypothetical protein
MIYIVEMTSDNPNNLRGCSVGTTDVRDFPSMPMRWTQVASYMYQVP